MTFSSMPRLQFKLRTIFWLTAIAAVLCLMAPFAVRQYRDHQRRERLRAQREQTDKIFDPINMPAGRLR